MYGTPFKIFNMVEATERILKPKIKVFRNLNLPEEYLRIY